MIDWNVVINPLLSGGSTNFTVSNAVSIIEAINEHETSILHHEPIHESFYSSFVALAGNMLANSFSVLPKDFLKQTTSACQTLLQFCVNRIVAYDRLSSQCAITRNNFSSVIQCLCVKIELDRSDIITYTAMIKSAKLPSIVKNKHSLENKENEPDSESDNKTGHSKRLDSSELFLCLSSDSKHTPSLFQLANDKDDVETALLSANTSVLQQLALKHELFKSYLGLPYLLRYVNRHRSVMMSHQSNEMKPLMLPITGNDAVVVKNGLEQLQGNIRLILDATKVPIVEPFDSHQLAAHTDVVLSCLCASISVAVAITALEYNETSHENSDVYGTTAQNTVKDGIEIYLNMKDLLEKSNQFGGQVSRNFKLIALYYVSQGMRAIDKQLQGNEKKTDATKIKSRKISDTLVVALSSLFTSELQTLLDDCDSSARLLVQDKSNNPSMTINLLQINSATQRFQFLSHYCNVIELLMNSMYKCFEQVYKKKSMKKGIHGEKHVTLSSKITVKQAAADSGASEDEDAFGCDGDLSDEFSSSENNSVISEITDTGNLILGAWMIDLMKSVDAEFAKEDKKDASQTSSDLPLLDNTDSQRFDNADNGAQISSPVNIDPNSVFGDLSNDLGVLQHCSKIIKVLDDGFLSSGNLSVIKYFRVKFTDRMAEDLSAIICVLDYGAIMDDFDGIALMSFIQNLITCDKIDHSRRVQMSKLLMSKPLVINPHKLLLGPKAMSIQAQMLLQQQQLAKSDGNNSNDVLDFMYSVVDHFRTSNSNDLPVEVLQFTLFLFHTLTNNGKEDFLKKVSSACVGLSKSTPLCVSRLLLLLDYLLHNYTNPSSDLLQHVRWNFFSIHGLLKKIGSDKITSKQRYNAMKKYVLFQGIQNAPNLPPKTETKEKTAVPLFGIPLNQRKASGERDKGDTTPSSSQKAIPTPSLFFDLRSDSTNLTDKETSEPDLIALNLLMEDMNHYNILYSSFIQCLAPGNSSTNLFCVNIEKSALKKKAKPGKTDLVSTSMTAKYCFQLAWRIIQALPPSETFQKLSVDEVLNTTSDSLVALYLLSSPLTEEEDAPAPESKSTPPALSDELNEIISKLVDFTAVYLNKHFLKPDHSSTLFDLLVTESYITQLQSILWAKLGKELGSIDPSQFEKITGDLLPSILFTMTKHTALTRTLVIQLASKDDPDSFSKTQSAESVDALLASAHIDSARIIKNAVSIPVPQSVNKVLTQWSPYKKKFKDIRGKKNSRPLDHTLAAFLKALAVNDEQSAEKDFAVSLVYLQEPLHQLCDDLIMWVKDSSSEISTLVCDALVPLLCDVTCADVQDQLKVCLEKAAGGKSGSKEMNDTLNFYSLNATYKILVRHINPATGLSNMKVAIEYMSYLEKSLPDASMQRAMHKFFVPADFKDSTSDESKTNTAANKDDNITFKGNVSPHSGSIVDLLLSNRLLSTPDYSNRLLQFVAKLCKTANSSDSESLSRLGPVCSDLCTLNLDQASMRSWVANFELDMVSSSGESLKEDISSALLTLSHFIVSKKNPSVQQLALSLLDAILPDNVSDDAALHTLQLISPTFVIILATLANAKDGSGHYRLTAYVFWWLRACIKMLESTDASENMHSLTENKVTKIMATCSPLLLYIRDILHALIKSNCDSTDTNEADDSDLNESADAIFEHECEFEDEDAQTAVAMEDDSSLEEEGLWNKLCTYTITQKKFMNQHWYHCHTCDMVDGVGVCTICAKVCHKGHELSYAKFGSFFCDCGAKEDKSCKAMVKRVPGSNKIASGISAFSDSNPASASASAASTIVAASSNTSNTSQRHGGKKSGQQHTPVYAAERLQKMVSKKGKSKRQTVSGSPVVIDGCKEKLLALITNQDTSKLSNMPRVDGVAQILHEVLQAMSQIVYSDSYKLNTVSGTARALKAIEDLSKLNKESQLVDTLMVPTLGSQEGAFENVKANFSGEQGQTIRQLINSRVLRRVAMCCLSAAAGRRQHLAVSHEKGKVTLLQLSALLKQADASKRKLTLTRLSTTQMPFAVITITANPSNDEVLAVCGLKDCHILTFASSPQATAPAGSVLQHLVLHPQLAASNYIIRAIWLPAMPTLLALVTGDFIKVYDLSKDILSPCYYYLLPTGKIRDATFVGGRTGQFDTCLIVMSSTGHLYSQFLHKESLAVHGTFYLTNVLSVTHKNLKENGGQVGGGGSSVFFSHSLCLLFFSYTNGNNFASVLNPSYDGIENLFLISYKPSSSNSNSARNGSGNSCTLYEWSEVVNHPGMITCFAQNTGCPVVLMIEPEKILLQEIKATSNKSKIQDLVAVRHSSATGADSTERTTVIVLCEDGSLRIYLASSEQTGYWLQPRLRPTMVFDTLKHHKKTPGASTGKNKDEDEIVGFPIDFFESCQALSNSDLEFGGDLLEVYNPAQIKNRLNSNGMYLMGKRIFNISITQKNSNMVITGLRVLVGSQGGLKAPTYFYIEDRYISLGPRLTRARWFDVPLTRAESLKNASKIVLTCGPSEDPDDYNVIDSLKVYAKTKETFGWPPEDNTTDKKSASSGGSASNKASSPNKAAANGSGNSDVESDVSGVLADVEAYPSSGIVDEMLYACLVALNTSLHDSFKTLLYPRDKILQTVSGLLVQPLSPDVHSSVKRTLTKLFHVKPACSKFQDEILLLNAVRLLSAESTEASKDEEKPSNTVDLVDEEGFQRILSHLSHIARNRPLNIRIDLSASFNDSFAKLMELENNPAAVEPVTPAPAPDSTSHIQLLLKLISAFWRLLANKPRCKLLTRASLPGLTRIDVTVKAMVDVIHAVSASVDGCLETASGIYFDLLTCPNPRVSFAARSALIKLLETKQEIHADGGSVILRSSSKMSETPPSTRSASPPSVTSSNRTGAVGRGFRISDMASDRPGSHVSSRGTAGGTTDDAEEDDDDDDNDDDDDDDDDDNDEDEFEHLGNDEVAMAIEEQLMGGDDNLEFVGPSNPLQNNSDFFQQNILPTSVTEAAASEYSRLLMGAQSNQEATSSAENDGVRLAESRSLTMDMMRAMAAEVAREEQAISDMNDQDQQDIENMIMGVDFNNLLPPDADDDEAMVEYAIALSLQQQEQQQQQQQGEERAPNGQSLPIPVPAAPTHNRQRSIDASSIPSDGVDQSPSAIPAMPEQSSHVEAPDSPHAHFNETVRIETPTIVDTKVSEAYAIDKAKLMELRLAVLKSLFSKSEKIESLGGEQCIPFFQVICTLALTLNPSISSHSDLLRDIVITIVRRLNSDENENVAQQTPAHEVHVIMMRLLSIMMSKSQAQVDASSKAESVDGEASDRNTYSNIASLTATILTQEKVVDFCFNVLSVLYNKHWKVQAEQQKVKESPSVNVTLLRHNRNSVSVDMSPFFLHQYVQSHAGALFEPYLRLITEMALNLTYQVRKQYTDSGQDVHAVFGRSWRQLLSEYMLFAGVPSLVRRRARKLLLYIAGSKDKYREERDLHALECYIKESSKLCKWSEEEKLGDLNLTYDELIQLVELIKKCCEIADNRNKNWQRYCVGNGACLPFLLDASVHADESVAVNALKLLLCAINPSQSTSASDKHRKSSKTSIKLSATTKDPKVIVTKESKASAAMAKQLSQAIMNSIKDDAMLQFLRHFLLEMNTTSIRWSAHALVHNLFKNSTQVSQEKLVKAMWSLWPNVVTYGQKAAQFVDLLGYLSMNLGLSPALAKLYTDATFESLKKQNDLLSNHQNAILYSQLANYVQFDGYYLENNPCLVCNQAELPFTSVKLTSIKGDTKYTTTQQITKLIGSYNVQKVTIKVTDVKRTKMIRTAVLFYNNKKVPAIVDLKNKPSMWHRAKSVTVPQGESEIRFDLPLPVVATNLMIEFIDFYENVSASIETLQCPRCSASVQANPGICSNCGENVFQCHKCRSINYDEKDPYLCNVCGFSKYAKFDVTVVSRPCCAVESIENDEDRKKMVSAVGSLLEKADAVYNQLNAHKPQLETLLLQVSQVYTESSLNQIKPTKPLSNAAAPASGSNKTTSTNKGLQQITVQGSGAIIGTSQSSAVSSNIQQLAKKYCQECKALFEELSSIMRTVLASRSEIVDYDRRQLLAITGKSKTDGQLRHMSTSSSFWCQSAPGCYGCASATAQQCITLLRVLANNENAKPLLVSGNVITELVSYNLRRTTTKTRKQVHNLIGQLVKNNFDASSQLNNLLLSRIIGAVNHHGDDLASSAVAHEIELLKSMLEVKDDLWQIRLKAVVELFQNVVSVRSPAVVENVTLPCTDMLRKMASCKSANKSSYSPVSVSCEKWLKSEPGHDFNSWQKRRHKVFDADKVVAKDSARKTYLQEKYARKWKDFVSAKKYQVPEELKFSDSSFLRQMLFCQSSTSIREVASLLVVSLAQNPARRPLIIDLLTSFLNELGTAGESASRFLSLYHEQIEPKQYRVQLAVKGALPLLSALIQKEITKLAELEETTLSLHLQQGFALKELIEILTEIVQVSHVRQRYKSSLVGTVLNSYLSLRRLVIQRTNLVDDAQEMLLELLEELTTGTESETRAFVAVCIEAIKKQDLSDLKTPQFIFERLANIIYPEETDTSEFFLSLDKDPLQEDFLQGRMVGNPYSSNEPGLGPLMRDVKNKICRDCDLIALLEDDSGMEILVNNKIIALDLPVREVYKKIWLPNHNEDDAMHVVYRMRGLLGEATEDIVERLDSDKTDQDEEEVYKLASVLSECGGIEVMLSRLESVKSLLHARQLVDVILKLLSYAVKLKVNRRYLAQPKLNTLNTLLGTLNLGLQAGEDGVAMVDLLLQIMWRVLEEASAYKTGQEKRDDDVFTDDKDKLMLLLQQVDSEFVRGHTNILQGLLRIIPFLSFGDPDLMQMLVDHFIAVLNFEKYDENHSDDETIYLNCFCEIVAGIQVNESGNQLKDLIVKNGIVQEALAYINKHIPENRNYDGDDWKAFISRPGLPYCLKMLAGLCKKHKMTQELVGKSAVSGLHRLEQISSEGSIGSYAENVLESLQEHANVAQQIKQVRRQTRAEKKKKAMEVRQQQLGALGMHTNEKGQVISKSSILQQISELVEEAGLTCIICREGYKFEPKKVLGIYTYTRRCALEEFENKPRKQQGYSTVSHFNVVHYDCHTSAVRMARGREEWDSALLQNASTKCNGLLPLWGAQVPEAAFASCLARHNTYIQEATGQREPGFHSNVHDLKLLLLRFAHERSFSEETGGGGRQSNINLIPYLIHAGLYVVNSTRNQAKEDRLIADFFSAPKEKWVESAYEVEGPLFVSAMLLFFYGPSKWKKDRQKVFDRILVIAQSRITSPTHISTLAVRELKDYSSYKPYLLFYALVDLIITHLFKNAPDEGGSSGLANYIRHNDCQLLDTAEKMLLKFQDEILVCESLAEFVDVMEMHDFITDDVNDYLKRLFEGLPAQQ